MKKTLLTIALAVVAGAAFAQGKVTLANDSGSLYTLSGAPGATLAPDSASAGMPIAITGPLPSGVMLEVGLWGGTSSTALTLQTEVMLNPQGGGGGAIAGETAFQHVLTTFPGGGLDYFQVAVWNSAYSSPDLSAAAGASGKGYVGYNHIFSMTPGTSFAYPNINNGGGTTWAAVGDEAPLLVGIIPEPSTFALAGLGAAALMIFRRRK